ncbi:hypothetical protein CALVIDRAFT_524840 [Calocera viscosa TUFC12733]|uniref:Uncharacterized protein n=1 Tax=Calocera viscosa (strain TUFC12733) TaxID=1330018 RepID=A0A167R3X3_CALVF|nr:hypothetical protein CALVIDRAFT_524840 [Calocera viscosa TUFC12733]
MGPRGYCVLSRQAWAPDVLAVTHSSPALRHFLPPVLYPQHKIRNRNGDSELGMSFASAALSLSGVGNDWVSTAAKLEQALSKIQDAEAAGLAQEVLEALYLRVEKLAGDASRFMKNMRTYRSEGLNPRDAAIEGIGRRADELMTEIDVRVGLLQTKISAKRLALSTPAVVRADTEVSGAAVSASTGTGSTKLVQDGHLDDGESVELASSWCNGNDREIANRLMTAGRLEKVGDLGSTLPANVVTRLLFWPIVPPNWMFPKNTENTCAVFQEYWILLKWRLFQNTQLHGKYWWMGGKSAPELRVLHDDER